MSSNKRALGRGLSALLSNDETDITNDESLLGETSKTVGSTAEILISQIETNPFQPRTEFDKEALLELADSIKELGIIQPITVRKLGYDKYQLISGERRFRASQIAGLKALPAYIRIANDQAMLEMALVENIQRRDLDAIEVAISYNRLIDECNLTQEELAGRVGKKRSTVTNYMRLLKLPGEIQNALREQKISMGHARALVTISDTQLAVRLCQQIIEEGLSVRAVEQILKGEKAAPTSTKKEKKNSGSSSFQMQKLTEDLNGHFNSKIKLTTDNKGGGKIVIPYISNEDLQRIIGILDL
jgi:ParB family chromosome partitioning protein